MSLFQLCYGPEIHSIFHTIQSYPNIRKEELVNKFQYKQDGNIDSLIEETLQFLDSLKVININENKEIKACETNLDVVDILKKLNLISERSNNPGDPNYVFTNIYIDLFVKPNQLFIGDLHYEINKHYELVSISKEKVNAWKRMMEYFGLGYRYNGGFYALPNYNLLKSIIRRIGKWDGPLQQFFERVIYPIIPCLYKGDIYRGIVFGLLYLNKVGLVQLSRKQDIPFGSFGGNNEWNWITVRSEGE
ncbi:hypothetical protein J0K78_03345 [Halobacillus sp. GSS1]|uniref:hypothetical protein n=1 Tax=Halobacillus sp. GSS1 TaxID=2815919 RepID=UPI001A8F553C|nr:hypothetical protein [Halobacillus sp. GSS1]MBN9653289.1 hypothetical protein [Halobacillus sp. GSS1]